MEMYTISVVFILKYVCYLLSIVQQTTTNVTLKYHLILYGWYLCLGSNKSEIKGKQARALICKGVEGVIGWVMVFFLTEIEQERPT